MEHNQPMQTKPREQFVQIPVNNNNTEHNSSSLINQTGTSNMTSTIKWPTIIICIIFVITGQSITKLLENFYYLHTINKRRGTWILYLLQSIGFPLLRTPLYFLLYPNPSKPNQLRPSSDRTSLKFLTILYPSIGIAMVVHSRLYVKGKLEIPSNIFTLIYTTQLLFTPILSFLVKKYKLNRWMVISLIFSIAAGSLTLYSSFAGEPSDNKVRYRTGVPSALFAAIIFSYIISSIQNVFDNVISKRDVATNRNPSFASVFELIFFSAIVATIISLAAVFISGEHHVMKRDIREFPEGKKAYLMAMIGLVVAWQIYWIGLVGLVFAVSGVFSNIVSVSTWPVVSVLAVVFFGLGEDEVDAYKGVALACAFLSVVSYCYRLHKENNKRGETI